MGAACLRGVTGFEDWERGEGGPVAHGDEAGATVARGEPFLPCAMFVREVAERECGS